MPDLEPNEEVINGELVTTTETRINLAEGEASLVRKEEVLAIVLKERDEAQIIVDKIKGN